MSNNYQGELPAKLKNTIRPAIEGTAQLHNWLHDILCGTANNQANIQENEYYRLFKLGDLEAIIRVHNAKNPQQIKVWFQDLLGRPVPKIVRKTVDHFFNEHFKLNQTPFVDLYENERWQRVAQTHSVNNESLPTDKELQAIKKLLRENAEPISTMGLFHHNKQTPVIAEEDVTNTNENTPVKNNS